MRRRDLLTAGVCTTLLRRAAAAQELSMRKLGILISDAQPERGFHLFREGLRDLGYVEGRNIHLETRSAGGEVARLPRFAAELIGLRVDAIAAFGTRAVLAAKDATAKIPIVFLSGLDPVAAGWIKNLARPGGNITGISSVNAGLGGKHVELLAEIMPGLSGIAVLLNAEDAFAAPLLESIQLFGKARQIEIVPLHVRSDAELETVFATVMRNKVGGVIVQGSLPLKHAADLAIQHRLPSGAPRKIFALNGGLIAYSPNGEAMLRDMARLVDKVLKGAKPADLPVEEPTRFELAINLKTATALGLTVPPSLLARADEVIE